METIFLQRMSTEVPWGFRLYGGCDYAQPLTVQKVTDGSVASESVVAGDVILRIGNNDASTMTHAEAMQAIKNSGTSLQLGISRTSEQELSAISSPQFDRQLNLNDTQQTNGNWSHKIEHQQDPKVPDAILNMAARGDSKKPFSYVPDINDIQMQREKVKKRSPGQKVSIPSYQNLLSMPHFDDAPKFVSSPPIQSSGDAVVSNLQFNTPLQMYSTDNVIESLKGQTGAEIKDVIGLPKKKETDITQSAVYKMIHGIDQPKVKPVISYAENKSAERPEQDEASEYPQKSIRYTGHNIPSRSFRMLQDMTSGDNHPTSAVLKFSPPKVEPQKQPTGNFRPPQHFQTNSPGYGVHYGHYGAQYGGQFAGPRRASTERREGSSEVDTTSIYQHLKGSDDYNEKSVRYVGKSIPSKCFRLLQDMTGGPRENDALPGPPKRHPMTGEVDVPVDTRYNTPSQSFKMLQRFVQDESSPHPLKAPVTMEEATDF